MNDTLYSYTIGRVDFTRGRVDVSRMGFSQGFLSLICIDAEVLE